MGVAPAYKLGPVQRTFPERPCVDPKRLLCASVSPWSREELGSDCRRDPDASATQARPPRGQAENSTLALGLLEHVPGNTGAAPGGGVEQGGVGESPRDVAPTVAFQHLVACLRRRESRLPGPVSELSSADSRAHLLFPGAPGVPPARSASVL